MGADRARRDAGHDAGRQGVTYNWLPTPPKPPTAKVVVHCEGSAQLVRFVRSPSDPVADRSSGAPVLIVPSLIKRWSVLDLRPGRSVVQTLVDEGLDVFLLDWGGALTHREDRRRFDPSAIAAAGKVGSWQMESGFSTLRPTLPASKAVYPVLRSWLRQRLC